MHAERARERGMANRERGEIAIEVEGKPYTLVLNTNAMALVEEQFSSAEKDATWDEIVPKLTRRPSVRSVRVVVWAMLQEYHAKQFTTIREASKFIDAMGGIVSFGEVLGRAATSVTPDPRDLPPAGDTENPRKAQAAPRDGSGDHSLIAHGVPV